MQVRTYSGEIESERPLAKSSPVKAAADARYISRRKLLGTGLAVGAVSTAVVQYWDDVFLKRFAEIIPGELYRAAWQRPWPVQRMAESYGIRSILSLAAMGTNDIKYQSYKEVVQKQKLEWVLIPVVGSYMNLAQMAEAADWVEALPKPLVFHCVAGHHRTTQAHTAWRIRHHGWSFQQAWNEVSQLRWTDPEHDVRDRSLVQRFAESAYARKDTGYEPMAIDALAGPGHPRVCRSVRI